MTNEQDKQHLQELAAYHFTVENLRARVVELEAQLAEETDAADNWRRLALQFDNHRMQAIGHLKAVTNPDVCFDKYKAAKKFLNAPPLDGEVVLAQRLAELATTPATVDMGIPMSESDASVGLTESVPSGMRLVNAGALQMVINALRRDAEEGKVVRGEMADELLATVGQAQAVKRIAIDMKQTAELLDLFGGEPTEFTVMQCNGHSGPGLYAYVTEYPEDGASYLGKTDCEAQPAPKAQAVCGIANKELRTEHAMQLVDAWYEAMKCGSVITRGEARQRIVEFVDALAATHPTQQGLDAQQLHNDIMNIPCAPSGVEHGFISHDYKAGHRDARHAAAELVLAAQAKQGEQANG